MKEEIRKVVLLSLASDFFASLLFIFALSLKNTVIIVLFYLICLLLIISALLACYNNYKKRNRTNLCLYMVFLSIILICLYTFVMIKSI